MTDLLTYDEAADTFRLFVDGLIDQDPDGARTFLGLGSDAPLVLSDSLLRRGAWVGMLTHAITVRCTHECEHDRRFAYLRFGVLACADCMEEWERRPREGDGLDCDICGADIGPRSPFAEVEHLLKQLGVRVLARACVACGGLEESLTLPLAPMSLN